jgi:colicin import membrane protein
MSTAVYAEPYRMPAGVLALAVHSVFFALLYFGFSWNRPVVAPAAMSVELWASLPEQVVAPVELKVEEVIPPPVQEKKAEPLESQIAEPEIIMPEKKLITPKPAMIKPEKLKPVIPKVVEKVKPKPEAQKPAEPNLEARRLANEKTAREQAAQEAAQQADREQAARIQAEQNRLGELAMVKGRLVDEYKAKIMAKIRSHVVMPPDVGNEARAEFLVTLLPGGGVLKAELKKSSGNAAYDNAVERAILKSDPLPLPPDAQLFRDFRELDMVFKPTQ